MAKGSKPSFYKLYELPRPGALQPQGARECFGWPKCYRPLSWIDQVELTSTLLRPWRVWGGEIWSLEIQ